MQLLNKLHWFDEDTNTFVQLRAASPYVALRINNKEYYITHSGRLEGVAYYQQGMGEMRNHPLLSSLLKKKKKK